MSKKFEAVTVPKWGIEMTHGRIVEWRCSEGEPVKLGDELVDIETDKIVNSFEARVSGTLARILVTEGEEWPVGTLIGVIALGEYQASDLDAFIATQVSGATNVVAGATASPAPSAEVSDNPSSAQENVKISPALLRKLNKAGIDPVSLSGSGPGGRILKEDIDRAIAGAGVAKVATGHGLTEPLSASQQSVAANLSKAQMTVPIYHVRRDVTVGDVMARLKAEHPNTPSLLNALLVQAIADALAKHPTLNSQFDGENRIPMGTCAIAVAVARDDGAVAAPVLSSVGERAILDIALELKALVDRGRSGRLAQSDMQPAAITLSNLGMFGVDDFTAMVTPPQIMVLSVGKIRIQPVWDEQSQTFKPEQCLMLTLGSDHRVVNGADAAKFLQSVASFIEQG